ncbi:MAG: tetratricopeptide repeat protein [Anaerolineae bacterium]|jgi:tetratricopeptide (TPR) repeat protein|nr:tetratricopeptide repeat protein [Anaerolineae bacterium]
MIVQKTVFISYRRINSFIARAVYQNLSTHGFDTFMDVETLDAGAFDQMLLNQIAARAHFVLILTPTALERCANPGDWLRREIEHAIDLRRNIVPLMFDNFEYSTVTQYLTGKLSVLPSYNAIRVYTDYFDEAMERLRERFLRVPLEVVLHPTPPQENQSLQEKQHVAKSQPKVSTEDLEVERYIERAKQHIEANNWDYAIMDCEHALQLHPNLAEAYAQIARARLGMEDFDGAYQEAQYAIRLDPANTTAYLVSGQVDLEEERYQSALQHFQNALQLSPNNADLYLKRGTAYYYTGDFKRAIADYTQSLSLIPRTEIYWQRGTAYMRLGDYIRSNQDFEEYIANGGSDPDAAREMIEKNNAKHNRP